ncbi:MAG: hypothetical protein H0Z32_12180 [Bacillaceae bacterium]|nr:hypothetical protein [Bacillaceae bacterium]
MNPYEAKVKEYLDKNVMDAEHLVFEKSCHTVQEAAEAVGSSEDHIVKNVCMIGENQEFIVAIVEGNNRVSTKRVAKALNIERPRMADQEEVLARAGFPAGGVPSFGFDAIFLMDPKVTEMDWVYTGGGSDRSLVKIKVEDLLSLNHATVARVRK